MGSDVYGRAVARAEADKLSDDARINPALTDPGPPVHRRRSLRAAADPILAAVVFALFARTFLFQAFEVPSPSMEKTVLTGDRLLVNKFVYAPELAPLSRLLPRRTVRRGDILVFRFPGDPRRSFVKRVVALPGETVSIADKRVHVDGRELIEPYAFHSDDNTWANDPSIPEERKRRDQLPPTRVPDGAYFLLGDNRDDSSDSRSWGPVPAGHILGRALLVYWSATPPPSGGGTSVQSPLGALRRTRWDRVFALVR
jgi:signal peptidase I